MASDRLNEGVDCDAFEDPSFVSENIVHVELSFEEQVEYLFECIRKFNHITEDYASTRQSVDSDAYEMPLQERDDDIERALEAMKNNRRRIFLNESEHVTLTLSGGRKSGKTRLAWEIYQRIEQEYPDTYVVLMDFMDGDSVDYALETNYSPSLYIGIRIAARLFFKCSLSKLLTFLAEYGLQYNLSVFKLEVVMEVFYQARVKNGLQPDQYSNLIVVMDNTDILNVSSMVADLRSYACRKCEEKQSAVAHQLYILPIICGSNPMIQYEVIRLKLLSVDAMKNILMATGDFATSNTAWFDNKTFMNMLKLIGGLPGALEKVIQICRKFKRHKYLTQEIADGIVIECLTETRDMLYLVDCMLDRRSVQKFLCLALSGVNRIGTAMNMAEINISHAIGLMYSTDHPWAIIIPYPLLVDLMHRILGLPVKYLYHIPSFTWRDFIEIEPYIHQARLGYFASLFCRWTDGRDFFSGATMSQSLEQQSFMIEEYDSKSKMELIRGNCNDHFAVPKLRVLDESSKEVKFIKKISFMNEKDLSSKKVTFADVLEWRDEALKSLQSDYDSEKYSYVFIYITKEEVENVSVKELASDLVIIDRPRLEWYCGPSLMQLISVTFDS